MSDRLKDGRFYRSDLLPCLPSSWIRMGTQSRGGGEGGAVGTLAFKRNSFSPAMKPIKLVLRASLEACG